ncbi:hypothetical protein O181_049212 [Austropuccinia psidii MF-1]|uniref:Uncharacterized protein n=1 Tax=Austropuccinia psidii MF-1 TaxID=1389203 RepID=A0A9Q3DWJ9_9BASI|nr:hypothetical protein [Austropuccinia psidii MF-1]
MAPLPNPLYGGGLGLNGLFGPFRPASGWWDGEAPFGPIPIGPKGAKVGISAAPNHKTQIGHKLVHGLWQPSGASRSDPSKNSPPVQGKNSLSSMNSILKDQEWCIYDIIYHYAPCLLRNPMVTLSAPNYVIPNQVPSPSTLSKEDFSAIQSGNSLAATRIPFKDPNHLALQMLGFQSLIRTIMSEIRTGYQSFQSLSRYQVFSLPWTT